MTSQSHELEVAQPMQRERRRDPYPWTWEIPVAVILATLFVIVIGIQLGRSVANLLAGAGWTWPDRQRRRVPLADRDRVLDQPARCPRRPRRRRPARPDPRRPGRPRPGVGQPRAHRARPADRDHLGRRRTPTSAGDPDGCAAWPPRPRPRSCWASPGSARSPASSAPTSTASTQPPRRRCSAPPATPPNDPDADARPAG